MSTLDWIKEFPASIEVCDREGILLDLNDHAAAHLASRDLIGSNVLDCHGEASRAKLAEMLESGQANVYTIEKAGQRKLIYQAPWYKDGAFAGFVELSLPIPWEMAHHVRS